MDSLPFGMEAEAGKTGPECSRLKSIRYSLPPRRRTPGCSLEADCQKRGAAQQAVLHRGSGAGLCILGYQGGEALSPGQMDAFWELCYAVSAGLLKEKISHQVGCWDRMTRANTGVSHSVL